MFAAVMQYISVETAKIWDGTSQYIVRMKSLHEFRGKILAFLHNPSVYQIHLTSLQNVCFWRILHVWHDWSCTTRWNSSRCAVPMCIASLQDSPPLPSVYQLAWCSDSHCEQRQNQWFCLLAPTKKALDPQFLHEVLRVLDADHWSHPRPRSSPGQIHTTVALDSSNWFIPPGTWCFIWAIVFRSF